MPGVFSFTGKQHKETEGDQDQCILGYIEGHYLGGKGTANIGPHNDTHGLGEGHKTGRNKADYQHGSDRRGIEYRRNKGTG